MRANPGGQLAPSDVVGRDKLIADLWRILDRQSATLTAERRVGKTSILKKMVADAPDGKVCIYRDLEGVQTPVEFVEAVFHDVESHLSRTQRAAVKALAFLKSLSGVEAGGVKLPPIAEKH